MGKSWNVSPTWPAGAMARIVIIPTASENPERSGEATLDSDIMALSEGRIVAKSGAEGLLCLAVPERGLGIPIAADDGSSRALGPAAVAVIEQLALTEPAVVDTLRERHVER